MTTPIRILTVAAHLVLVGVIFDIYAGPLQAPPASLNFVMFKVEPREPPKLNMNPKLISAPKIVVPPPDVIIAPHDDANPLLGRGPVAYALSYPTYLAQIRAHLFDRTSCRRFHRDTGSASPVDPSSREASTLKSGGSRPRVPLLCSPRAARTLFQDV